jgi:8-oxo-dGTP pyrophosphatase MutT (NUDIX family)
MALREGVRALILDEDESFLPLRFDGDGLDVPGGFWANPGGGIEARESRKDALARELVEEVGLRITNLGPEAASAALRPEPRLTPEQLLAENVHEIRWWTRDQLAASDATFSPRALSELLENLLTSAVPAEPVALTGF